MAHRTSHTQPSSNPPMERRFPPMHINALTSARRSPLVTATRHRRRSQPSRAIGRASAREGRATEPAVPAHRRQSSIEFIEEVWEGAAPEPAELGGPGAVEPGVFGAAGVDSSSECCSATGVSHSLGRQRSRNGTIELTEASRFTQEGISRPVSSCRQSETVRGASEYRRDLIGQSLGTAREASEYQRRSSNTLAAGDGPE